MAESPVTVEVGDESYEAVASTAEGAERERLWSLLTQHYPFFVEHQQQTDRVIPVVILTRA